MVEWVLGRMFSIAITEDSDAFRRHYIVNKSRFQEFLG